MRCRPRQPRPAGPAERAPRRCRCALRCPTASPRSWSWQTQASTRCLPRRRLGAPLARLRGSTCTGRWPGLAWPGLAWPGLAWPGLPDGAARMSLAGGSASTPACHQAAGRQLTCPLLPLPSPPLAAWRSPRRRAWRTRTPPRRRRRQGPCRRALPAAHPAGGPGGARAARRRWCPCWRTGAGRSWWRTPWTRWSLCSLVGAGRCGLGWDGRWARGHPLPCLLACRYARPPRSLPCRLAAPAARRCLQPHRPAPAAASRPHPCRSVPIADAGVAALPGTLGTTVGATQLDRLLRVVPRPSQLALLQHAATLEPLAAQGAGGGLHVALALTSLDVSLVDHRPREVLLLSVDGLGVEYGAGDSAGVAYTLAHVRVNNIQVGRRKGAGGCRRREAPAARRGAVQCSACWRPLASPPPPPPAAPQVDDMQHGSPYPVVLAAGEPTPQEDPDAHPMLYFTQARRPAPCCGRWGGGAPARRRPAQAARRRAPLAPLHPPAAPAPTLAAGYRAAACSGLHCIGSCSRALLLLWRLCARRPPGHRCTAAALPGPVNVPAHGSGPAQGHQRGPRSPPPPPPTPLSR
jgi:hypothetical protein